jgi:hypothetical protein
MLGTSAEIDIFGSNSVIEGTLFLPKLRCLGYRWGNFTKVNQECITDGSTLAQIVVRRVQAPIRSGPLKLALLAGAPLPEADRKIWKFRFGSNFHLHFGRSGHHLNRGYLTPAALT